MKRAIRIASWLLVAVSTVFLAIVAQRHWHDVAALALAPHQWLVLALLAIAYAACLVPLGAAWHWVLEWVGAEPQGLRHSLGAHTTSQLAKYVPGNVFHFVGRHMIHRAAGMSDKKLALGVVVETVVLLAGAVLVALACLAMGGPAAMRAPALVALIVAILALGLGLLVVRRITQWPLAPALRALTASVASYAGIAAIIAAVAAVLGAPASWAIAAGGIAAWIAGFLTPGAPGGLGVREAAMVLIGGAVASPDLLLMTAVLFRVVSLCGEALCFGLGLTLFRETRNRLSPEPA